MALDYFVLVLEVIWALAVTQVLFIKQLFHHFIWSPRQKSVKDKVVVVCGAGHGLGRRIASEFGKLGAHVVCWDIDTERNENTAWDIRQSKGKAIAVSCDVTDRVEVFKTVATIKEKVGDVDILVNCVGIYPVQPTLSWTPTELYTLFDTNAMAQFWAVVPYMKQRGKGQIAVISSLAAMAPVAGELVYSATKSAVSGLMDGFRQELQLEGFNDIKVTCIHPYYTAVRTDIPVKYDLRFPRLSPDFVAGEIVKGIRQEQDIISVPRFLLFWVHFMNLLPQGARKRWREIIRTRVSASEENVKYFTDTGEKINIIDIYRLPPLKTTQKKHSVSVEIPEEISNNNNEEHKAVSSNVPNEPVSQIDRSNVNLDNSYDNGGYTITERL